MPEARNLQNFDLIIVSNGELFRILKDFYVLVMKVTIML